MNASPFARRLDARYFKRGSALSASDNADAESDGCTRRVRHVTQPREVSGHTDELQPLSLRLCVWAGGVCGNRTEPNKVRAAPTPVSLHR